MNKFLLSIVQVIIFFFLIRWVLSDTLEGKTLESVSLILTFFLDNLTDIKTYLRKIHNELREKNGKMPE